MNKMRKMVTPHMVILALFGLSVFSSTASANIQKGQKIYMKTLQSPCGFSGATFARNHTQDEWEAIYQSGKFEEVTSKICPQSKLKVKHVHDVYDFAYAYAKDSGNVPSY